MSGKFLPLPEPVRAWILDFDGVIVDSVHIKREAHHKVLASYPEALRLRAKPILDETHLPRYQKYERIAREVFGVEYPGKQALEWANRYQDFTRDAVIACAFIPGVVSFIERARDSKIPVYVASATPEDELRIILTGRGMLEWFQGIWGSPMKKIEMIREAIRDSGVAIEDAVFVGDSRPDLDAALTAGVPFLAVRGHYDFHEESRAGLPVIDDFSNFDLRLQSFK